MLRLPIRLSSVAKLFHTSRMPAFTLYGARGSTNTDRVRLTLADGGFTDYELESIDFAKGEQKSAENLKRHPFGEVPTVTFPDGFTLYESRAICEYLAKKYSFPLLPPESDDYAGALFDQAQSVEIFYFAESAGKIGFELVAKKKFMGLPPDEAVVANARKSLEAFFDVAERDLQHRDYVAGDSFTLIDIYYIPPIQRLFACGHGDLISSRKAVSAWWDRCIDRPGIKKMLAADKEAMAAASR